MLLLKTKLENVADICGRVVPLAVTPMFRQTFQVTGVAGQAEWTLLTPKRKGPELS